MPQQKTQSRTVEEKIDQWLAENPEATAEQTLAEATERVAGLRKAYEFPPPGVSEKWRRDTKEELDAQEVTLAKLQKKPTDAASSAAALRSCKARFELAMAKTNASVDAAQKNTEKEIAFRKEAISKARQQLEELEEEISRELKEFMEAHRLRGIDRSQEQQEMLAGFDARIAKVPVPTEAAAEEQPAGVKNPVESTGAAAVAAEASAMQAQLTALQAQMQSLISERNEHVRQQSALQRYLLVVPMDAAQLPDVTLPPDTEVSKLYYLQLYHLLSQWTTRGCFPFTEEHLRAEFPDADILKATITELLGTLTNKWHEGSPCCDVIPNQFAMTLLRQLERVCASEESSVNGVDYQEKAANSYLSLHASSKRLKLV